jgi:hypothetical protein
LIFERFDCRPYTQWPVAMGDSDPGVLTPAAAELLPATAFLAKIRLF